MSYSAQVAPAKDDSRPQGQDHLKRARRAATVMIALYAIGLAALVILALAGSPQYELDTVFGRAVVAAPALGTLVMAWNGSRLGAILMIALICVDISVGLFARSVSFSPGDWIRSLAYLGASIYVLAQLHHYHRALDGEDAASAGHPALRWGPLALVLPALAIIVYGSMIVLGTGFSQGVQYASEIKTSDYQWMIDQEFLFPEETVQFFYSDAVSGVADGGTVLTNRYLGHWWRENGDLQQYWFRLGEICKIETVTAGNALIDGVFKVHGPGPDNWVKLNLSVHEDRHKLLLARLNLINNRLKHPLVAQACDADKPIDYEALGLAHGIQPGIASADLVTEDQRKWLMAKRYLVRGEAIIGLLATNSYGLSEDGVLLTDKYFGGWYRQNTVMQSSWAKLGSICTISAVEAENTDESARYKIIYPDNDWFAFSLPIADGQDEAFIADLKARNKAAASEESDAACAAMLADASDTNETVQE